MKPPLLPCLLLLAACESAPPAVAPLRITLERATELVRAEVLRENPEVNPALEIPLIEITPVDAWQAMSVQLFQVRSDALFQAFETFAVRKGEVVRLGRGFGGDGVGSTLVTDLDGDRSPDLAFVYSWGSGRHLSQVGVLRIAGDRMQVLPCDWTAIGDSYLVFGEHRTAQVTHASAKVGTLRLVEGQLRVVAD